MWTVINTTKIICLRKGINNVSPFFMRNAPALCVCGSPFNTLHQFCIFLMLEASDLVADGTLQRWSRGGQSPPAHPHWCKGHVDYLCLPRVCWSQISLISEGIHSLLTVSFLPRPLTLAFTACSFPSYHSVWPEGPCSAMPVFCLLYSVSNAGKWRALVLSERQP